MVSLLVESLLVSLCLTIECEINLVNHVFNMSLDKLHFLGAYDIMNPAGDPTIFIPMGVHVGSPAVFNCCLDIPTTDLYYLLTFSSSNQWTQKKTMKT
jgi:hypothetical protein